MELLLLDPLFADVGDLEHFPSSNQVLQRRDGYRDVYRAYLQAEVAASISWAGGEDLFAAGQRDVATLYEFWTFLELARIVGSLAGFEMDRRTLLQLSSSGMSLQLRHGGATMLRGHGQRMGRRLELQLWFNRTFRQSAGGSWTETMRPDCSLLIKPIPSLPGDAETWLHFDAKYRVATYRDFFQAEEPEDESETVQVELRPMSQDLMKMHAYSRRDSKDVGRVRPLSRRQRVRHREHRQYHEILPGLGAFVMRPTEDGEMAPETERSLRRFLEDVLSHTAAGGTSQERADYWTQTAYRERGRHLDFSDELTKPAADTKVLLAYVKSDEHLAWIQSNLLYNMRADGRRGSVGLSSPELGVELVILYRPSWATPLVSKTTGAFFVKDRAALIDSGYPTHAVPRICVWS